jgi:two-component system response regulator MprA
MVREGDAPIVLVVDDHEDVRMALEALFVSQGLAVVSACEGEEALDRLRGGLRPCVIILDLMMPKLDGWQFRHAQLADPVLANIPVIAFSGHEALRDRASEMGITDVLSKPVDPGQLLGLVHRYCSAGPG